MIVYKVVFKPVSHDEPDYTSAIRGRQGFLQTYIPGEVTKAKLGWLFAFASLKAARAFAVHACLEIWEARTTCCEDITDLPSDMYVGMEERFEAFWKQGVIQGRSMTAPPETVICPELTLLRPVPECLK